ncbi:integrase core domain-containing protein [Methylocaldum szegediense]|uniref:integrase core domain-containing protein n=1 Tax=Methylocaldum szegediense TaxID=73780 RepID=UPI0037C5817F
MPTHLLDVHRERRRQGLAHSFLRRFCYAVHAALLSGKGCLHTNTFQRTSCLFKCAHNSGRYHQHLFTRLDDVREAAYWWMLEYNEERPHDSLGDLTPAEYRQRVAGSSTFEMPA